MIKIKPETPDLLKRLMQTVIKNAKYCEQHFGEHRSLVAWLHGRKVTIEWHKDKDFYYGYTIYRTGIREKRDFGGGYLAKITKGMEMQMLEVIEGNE